MIDETLLLVCSVCHTRACRGRDARWVRVLLGCLAMEVIGVPGSDAQCNAQMQELSTVC